jgi:putative transposase
MAERGVSLTYEAVRCWCRKFGQASANALGRRHPKPDDTGHLDEVFLTIKHERHYLWRAVDQDGHVLNILVQRRWDKAAAKRFARKLLKGLTYVPRVIITDKLASYGAAKREVWPDVEHRQHRYLNNRVENSHPPTRQRARRMGRFKSPGRVQRFLSAYGPIASRFCPDAIASRPKCAAKKRRDDSGPGRTSPAQPGPHKGMRVLALLPPCLVIASGRVSLTVPF